MQSLQITYRQGQGKAESYWLILEQDQTGGDAVTVENVGRLLDTLYDRDACDDDIAQGPPEDSGGQEAEVLPEPVVDADNYWDTVSEQLSFAACGEDKGRVDIALLRVYRSHLDEPYRLALTGGEQGVTTQELEQVKEVIAVRQSDTFALKKPVSGRFVYRWSVCRDESGTPLSPAPIVTADGPRGMIAQVVTGILLVEYETSYDLVKIEVPRNTDGTAGTCHVRCLYHGIYKELDVEPAAVDPTMDEHDRQQVCGGSYEFPGDDTVECYRRVYHDVLCACDGRATGKNYTTEEPCGCPAHWGDDVSPGRHLVGSYTVTEYTSCEGDGELTQEDYDEYEDVCCVPGNPPACREVYGVYSGGKKPDKDSLRSRFGQNVILVPLGPKHGACGKWVKKWKKPNISCCEGVAKLEIDYENTDWEVEYTRDARLTAVGGRPPYHWKCSGGYVLRDRVREAQTLTPENNVFVEYEGACGDAIVTLDDGCTEVTFQISLVGEVPQPVLPSNMVVSPSSRVIVELVEVSPPPYRWSASGGLAWEYSETEGPSNALIAAYNFCGTGKIAVTDGCGNQAQTVVRSSEGKWVNVPLFDRCNPPGGPWPADPGDTGCVVNDGYMLLWEWRSMAQYFEERFDRNNCDKVGCGGCGPLLVQDSGQGAEEEAEFWLTHWEYSKWGWQQLCERCWGTATSRYWGFYFYLTVFQSGGALRRWGCQ